MELEWDGDWYGTGTETTPTSMEVDKEEEWKCEQNDSFFVQSFYYYSGTSDKGPSGDVRIALDVEAMLLTISPKVSLVQKFHCILVTFHM